MSKQFKKRLLLPAERLAQQLAQHAEYDHSRKELADDVVAWLASTSTLAIEDRDIHVSLGGPTQPMVIVIDRIGAEVAEALAAGNMMGMDLVMEEPNLVMVGDVLFAATAQRIKGDPDHVSTLRMEITRTAGLCASC